MPQYTSFVSASNGGILQGDRVVWNIGSLPVGAPGQLTVIFEVDAPPVADGTQIVNTATLSADAAAPVSDTLSVTVSSAPEPGAGEVSGQGGSRAGQ